jgi:hypothetical protein
VAGGFKLRADTQCRQTSTPDRIGLCDRPAPEPHRRVALEVSDDSTLVEAALGHHPQRLAYSSEQGKQVGRVLLAGA